MNEVVIKPSLREQFLQGWAQCRVIFFSAPCGFGKSTAATALLGNHKTCVFSAEDPEFLHKPVPKNVDAIVIDSLPALKDPEDQQTLCAWIRENPELHFVILSRGVLPGWLMPFRFKGLLQLIEARDLLFDRDTVRVFLEKNGCTPTEAEINVIIHDSLGYPLALTALSRLMQNGQPYTPEIVGIVQQEIYHYFEDNIFNRFSMPLRRMLLDIAPVRYIRRRACPDDFRRQPHQRAYFHRSARYHHAFKCRCTEIPLLELFPTVPHVGTPPSLYAAGAGRSVQPRRALL